MTNYRQIVYQQFYKFYNTNLCTGWCDRRWGIKSSDKIMN